MGDALAASIALTCKDLKLPGITRNFAALARQAREEDKSYEAYLLACLRQEQDSRRENRLKEAVRRARFPGTKTLEGFDFKRLPELPVRQVQALASGDFARKGENVVCLGGSGTGKTHVAIALGLACVASGLNVRFTTALALSQELLQAKEEFRLPRFLKTYGKYDLVIVDELGYLGLGPGGPMLFQFFSERYERKSVLVTTNLDFGRWDEVFGDATMTAALLDRLTHHATVLLFKGESYRYAERQGTA